MSAGLTSQLRGHLRLIYKCGLFMYNFFFLLKISRCGLLIGALYSPEITVDIFLLNIPENGPPLVLLGDFNIQTEKSSDLLLLLSSFALSLNPFPVHKAGNHLEVIFTRNCSSTILTVTPIYVSDCFFICYSWPLSHSDNPITSTDSVPVCARPTPSLPPLWPHLFYQPSLHLTLSHSCILALPKQSPFYSCPPLLILSVRVVPTVPLCKLQKANGENLNTLMTCALINLFSPHLGVSGSALSLLSSYLKDHTYWVTWRGSVSEPCLLTTGVPHGSVLGPLLFSLYTNSFGSVINSHRFSYHSYADDTQLIISFPKSKTQAAACQSVCLTSLSGRPHTT